jgi:hypothetical protein
MGRSDSGGRKSGGDPSVPASSAGAISRAKSGLPWHVIGYRHLRTMSARGSGAARSLATHDQKPTVTAPDSSAYS